MPANEPAAKLAVTPLGRLEAASATVPENPPTSVIVIMLVPDSLWGTETAVSEAERVKPGAGLTAKLRETGAAAA